MRGGRPRRALPSAPRAAALLLGAALAVATLTAAPTARAQPFGAERAAPGPLAARLAKAKKATVSTACGSTVAPWAYRGSHGVLALHPYHLGKGDAKWVQGFVSALFAAGWDSVGACHGPDRPCDQELQTPLYVVTLHGAEDTYVVITFEGRCAIVFGADRPLGSVALDDRAASIFAMVQAALPPAGRADAMPAAVIDSAATAGAAVAGGDTMLAIGRYAALDTMPAPAVRTPPRYPEGARISNISGTVEVMALVGRDGAVHDAFVKRSLPGLDDAALDAVWQWTFRPARLHGASVAIWVTVPVTFALH